MTQQTTEREHQRILDVAREYRQRGYTVIIAPSPQQLPLFLAGFRIDILAVNDVEQVIIEVRTQESLRQAPELDALAEAITQQDGWRFELVVTNPKDRSHLFLKDAILLDQQDISYRLQEARQLSAQEHGEAAFMLAWSATEALLRAIAVKEALLIYPMGPGQVVKTLFTYGLLDKDQFEVLQAGVHTRNKLVHGYKESEALTDVLAQILVVANQLEQHYLST